MAKEENIHNMPIKKIYNEIIILDEQRINNKTMILIKCPHCGKERWINKDHPDRIKNTLCMSCARRKMALFYIDQNLDCAYFYVKDKENYIKVLIDYDIADKLFGCSFALSGVEKYVVITNGLNKKMRLTSFIMDYEFNENKYVPDHKNHNIYDNRRENLIIVKQTLNQGNKCMQSNNSSGFRGIHFDKSKEQWIVQIRYQNKIVVKKGFNKFIDAYQYWYKQYHEYYRDSAYNIFNDELRKINLKIAGIEKFDIENGKEIGCTLFTQGCSNHCKGCHNPETWSFDGGIIFTEEMLNDLISYYKKHPQIKRLTLSGGDPLQNMIVSNLVAAEFKRQFPNHKLWVYTGLLYDDIKDDIKYKALLELIDVLVDGQFIEEQKDLTLRFAGSKNQRLIDVQESLKQNKVVLYEE